MDKLLKLKEAVTAKASNPGFIHHQWYVKWHLQIVERLVNELCNIYTEADRNICLLLVWLHDYGKILAQKPENYDKGDFLTFTKGRELMESLGFSQSVTDQTISYLQQMERKMEEDLSFAPIEVQIISSADAASHLIGPFMSLYWYENPDKSIEELLESGVKKVRKDWLRKVTLPEIKKRFQERYLYMLENAGEFPDCFLRTSAQ